MHLFLCPLLWLTLTISCASTLVTRCPDTSHSQYDYIVVGAGAGGGPLAARLAESGFTVLVVDAGHEVVTVNTTIPVYANRAINDPQLELNYTLNEYPPDLAFQKDDIWYPRARGIGGCALHNGMANMMGSTESNFNDLVNITNDSTWSYDNMWEYFKRIEHNLYLPPPNIDHGYTGWLKTNLNPPILDIPQFSDPMLKDIVDSLLTSGPSIPDLNSRASAQAVGPSIGSFTANEVYNRSSIHERLVQVRNSSSGKLQFALDTLATKVLLCSNTNTSDTHGSSVPRAYGVEIAAGAALAVASNFEGKQPLKTQTVLARREIIVAAGVFQSPQLLMLSGIGDKRHLDEVGIETIVDLPGVGTNLQDHDEISTIWSLKENVTLLDGCTLLSTPEEDPCLAVWIESGHESPYSLNLAGLAYIISKSSPDLQEPDMLSYWTPGYFPGFTRDTSHSIPNALTGVNLHAHTSSRGTVRLTGSHPQDILRIEKHRFQAEGGPQDVAALREGIKVIRRLVQSTPGISAHVDTEVFPGPQAKTDEEIDAHVYENIFGHHGCCTNKIGTENDKDAVLDGDFRVRGVSNLRVVDMSSWPDIPGFFPTTPTYMMSEKAADVIIAAAQ